MPLSEKLSPVISEMIPTLYIAEPPPSPDLFSENDEFNTAAVPNTLKAPPTLAVFPTNSVLLMLARPTAISIAPPASTAKLPTNVQLKKLVWKNVVLPLVSVVWSVPHATARTAPPF